VSWKIDIQQGVISVVSAFITLFLSFLYPFCTFISFPSTVAIAEEQHRKNEPCHII
jgi:hypothetical protein